MLIKVIFFLLAACIGALLGLFELCLDAMEEGDKHDDTAKSPEMDDGHRR